MDAKEFELPLEGSISNLITLCYEQQKKTTLSVEKNKKRKKNKNIIKPEKPPKK